MTAPDEGWRPDPRNVEALDRHIRHAYAPQDDQPRAGAGAPWKPATDGELDAWGRGYIAGWTQGYADGQANA